MVTGGHEYTYGLQRKNGYSNILPIWRYVYLNYSSVGVFETNS